MVGDRARRRLLLTRRVCLLAQALLFTCPPVSRAPGAMSLASSTPPFIILAQFFDDQLLAFCVLAVAWLCEVTVAVSNRHWVSRHYLPRLLFTYFLAFHMYFFSYPLGYAWLSLGTCVAFMAHAVIALWNRWELPLLVTRQWQQHLRAQRQ